MTLQPDDLKQITSDTLQYYDDHAEEFWRGTSGQHFETVRRRKDDR